MRKIALLALIAVLFVSCSEPNGQSALDDDSRSPTDAAGSPSDDATDQGARKGKRAGDGKGGKAGKAGTKQEAASEDGDDGGAAADGDPYTEGPAEDDHSSPLFTAPGTYVYEQSGYERFCGAASCERESLPNRQTIEVTVKQRNSERAVVVAEARASGNRMMRTTTRFAQGRAEVTNVYARFSYQGFTFENSYQPDPPVESLRFPMSDGQSWAGRWRDSTSGTYRFSVDGREELEVGGRAVQAFKIAYEMTFSGEFEGTSEGTVWVDPATRAVVAASGRLDLRSSFGRYTTEGRTRLTSGPRYR